MIFKVVAIGETGHRFVGEGSDLSNAIHHMSECVIAAGTDDDNAHLQAELGELREVAIAIPDDFFGGTMRRDDA